MTDPDSSPPKLARMQNFARFFRGYMGSAPIIAAALPIPVTIGGVIPTYQEYTTFLTAYSSMFCFLAVAFVFYRRHRIGSYLLPELWEKRMRLAGRFIISWLPLALILLTALSIIIYHGLLNVSIDSTLSRYAAQIKPTHPTVKEILATENIRNYSFAFQALFFCSYLGIFLFSTLAFALMAVREYMQTELGLSETDLVLRSADPFVQHQPDSLPKQQS